MAKHSEIPASRWSSVTYKNVRMSTEELEVLKNLYPGYALWLISGEIAPECGQTSPDYDLDKIKELRKKASEGTPIECRRCKKKIEGDEITISETKPLGSKNNEFIAVCASCNVVIGDATSKEK